MVSFHIIGANTQKMCTKKSLNKKISLKFYILTILNGTVNRKGMSPCFMKQLAVSFVLSLKFIYLNMKGPNKHI